MDIDTNQISDLTELDHEIQEKIEEDVVTKECKDIGLLRDQAFKEINPKCIEDLEVKEKAIVKLATVYCKNEDSQGLESLIVVLRDHLTHSSKARTAKLLRQMLDIFIESNVDRTEVIQLCQECIQWAKDDRKTYLCQVFETKLVALYCDVRKMKEALELGIRLSRDFKKMDYRDQLVEVQLALCKIYYIIGNFQKSKAVLTSARTVANSTHLSTKLQAQIDQMSGAVHAKDCDYITAYSYFFESFELFDNIGSVLAVKSLKYMLLCKIMLNRPQDIPSVLSGKLSLKYHGSPLEAMKAVALTCKGKRLVEMAEVLKKYSSELKDDPIINVHLADVLDSLFESNLLMVIEPYSTVEISHVAKLVEMSLPEVINRIAKMILDKKLNATLDQGFGTIEVLPFKKCDELYKQEIESVKLLSNVVETLKRRRIVVR